MLLKNVDIDIDFFIFDKYACYFMCSIIEVDGNCLFLQ